MRSVPCAALYCTGERVTRTIFHLRICGKPRDHGGRFGIKSIAAVHGLVHAVDDIHRIAHETGAEGPPE